jgi:hypothetical protein
MTGPQLDTLPLLGGNVWSHTISTGQLTGPSASGVATSGVGHAANNVGQLGSPIGPIPPGEWTWQEPEQNGDLRLWRCETTEPHWGQLAWYAHALRDCMHGLYHRCFVTELVREMGKSPGKMVVSP